MPNDTFSYLDEGSCGLTHVDPFSTNVHLLFLECKHSAWLILIITLVFAIKIGQNYMYTKMSQLQREILQLPKDERGWCSAKILELLAWEFLSGIIGIASVLFITGNNAIIWASIILSNLIGVSIAFTQMQPDHHSTALEFLNMLNKYPTKGLKNADEESKKTYEAIQTLRRLLERSREDEQYVRDDDRESSPLLKL